MIRLRRQTSTPLLTALYVKIDDWLGQPRRTGRPPKLSNASHSRFFWGPRLHLICTPAGLPISWSLATPERRQNARC
ncbi:hypothetical protein Acsp02_96970 [Actinoplanes sp. NBRC 103695]|nr:hypothetical protein Acsp02_96970 [Actinoplanes sp. NBRC 103695]